MLDGSSGAGRRILDHREISEIYEGDMVDFINEGNIRLMPESPGITLIWPPNNKQYQVLKNYIDKYLYKDKVFYVDVMNESGYDIKSFEYSWPQNSTSEILTDLENYFKKIILYKSRWFLYSYEKLDKLFIKGDSDAFI